MHRQDLTRIRFPLGRNTGRLARITTDKRQSRTEVYRMENQLFPLSGIITSMTSRKQDQDPYRHFVTPFAI